jgi:hypothetical protein
MYRRLAPLQTTACTQEPHEGIRHQYRVTVLSKCLDRSQYWSIPRNVEISVTGQCHNNSICHVVWPTTSCQPKERNAS